MKISLDWLSDYLDLKGVSVERISETLTQRGLEVEAVEDQALGFENVVSAEILEKNRHPNADRLSLCKVSTGQGKPLAIVCGATNMKAGDKVALAQVGAQLPNGLEIKKSKIRDVESFGMLCSESELGLSEESDGILILPPETRLGKKVAKILERDDIILDLSVTPNRGDCLSHWGIARELASALGRKLKEPSFQKLKWGAKKKSQSAQKIALKLNAKNNGRQFFGCAIEGVQIQPSPKWIQKRLKAVGLRPINQVVDATNYVLYEFGQPTHAYDLDRLEGNRLSIDFASEGETLKLLDGSQVKLIQEDLIIRDSKKPVALAGVMGGGNSEVLESTTRIYLECADFSPLAVRKSASRHQRHTDSSHRFERGIDSHALPRAISRLASLILESGGSAKVQEAISAQLKNFDTAFFRTKISVVPDYFEDFLGMKVSAAEAKKALKSLGCEIKTSSKWTVSIPSWRSDLNLKEDLAEEVARCLGYDRLESTIPVLTGEPSLSSEAFSLDLELLDRAKDALRDAGLNEALQYAFNSKAWLKHFSASNSDWVRLMNPLSEDQEILIPSLLPGLIHSAQENWKRHFGAQSPSVRFFEIRPTFYLRDDQNSPKNSQKQMETGIVEDWKLALLISGQRDQNALKAEQKDVDFFDIKGILENLCFALRLKGWRWEWMADFLKRSSSSSRFSPSSSLWHAGQSVSISVGKEHAGFAGLIHPRLVKQLKLRESNIWIAELRWSVLKSLAGGLFQPPRYRPWQEFPSIERDFALVVNEDLPAQKITQTAMRVGKPLIQDAQVFDVYQGQQLESGKKSIAVRLIFGASDRSLREQEAEKSAEGILEKWKNDFNAMLRD